MGEKLECDACGDEINPGDDFLRISEMLRQKDGEIESKQKGYIVCRKESCLKRLALYRY